MTRLFVTALCLAVFCQMFAPSLPVILERIFA